MPFGGLSGSSMTGDLVRSLQQPPHSSRATTEETPTAFPASRVFVNDKRKHSDSLNAQIVSREQNTCPVDIEQYLFTLTSSCEGGSQAGASLGSTPLGNSTRNCLQKLPLAQRWNSYLSPRSPKPGTICWKINWSFSPVWFSSWSQKGERRIVCLHADAGTESSWLYKDNPECSSETNAF